MAPTYSIETSTKMVPRLDIPNYVTLVGREGYPDLFNSIRCAMLCHVKCFGFDNMIDPEDFSFIKNVLGVDLSHEHYTTLVNSTRYPSPVLSQRLGRLPIYTSPETLRVLTGSDDIMIVFLICDSSDPTKPLKNMDPVDLVVSSRSLVPRVYKKVDLMWQFDQEHTDRIEQLKSTIFYYDTLICTLSYGQELHAIVKPLYDVGFKDPRWQPCTWRFRHVRDPLWADEEGYKEIQLRKKPGQMGLKEQFRTMSPAACTAAGVPAGTAYDKLFSIPYEVQTMFVFNGKMDPRMAFLSAIDVLKDALHVFYSQYQVASTTLDDIDSQVSIIHKEQRESTQTLYVPYNSNDVVPEQYTILTQHAIGNILANKILYLFDTHIVKGDNSLYESTLIAYKVPHQLVSQCTYTLQLPLKRQLCLTRFEEYGITDDFHENLIKNSIIDLVSDLDTIKSKF
jgi:hypothetical protein